MSYPVAACRGRWAVGGAEDAWYLTGGIPAANCKRAYQPKGAASLAASYTDLTGNQDAAPGVAPDWDATNGWKGNGSTMYLTTGYTPGQNDSAIVRYSNLTNQGAVLGCYQTVPANEGILIYPSRSGSRQYLNGPTVKTKLDGYTSGVIAVADRNGYHNASLEVSSLASWTAAPTAAIYILAFNLGAAPAQICAAYIQAIAIYNIDISSYITDLTTAMNAL